MVNVAALLVSNVYPVSPGRWNENVYYTGITEIFLLELLCKFYIKPDILVEHVSINLIEK